MKRNLILAAIAALACISFSTSCSNSKPEVEETVSQKLTATIADNGSGAAWTSADVIGVYTDASEKNVKYTCSSASAGTFTAATEVSGAPQYAYYPYSTGNSSLNATGLKGSLPQDQTASAPDYRYGLQTGTDSNGDATFQFHDIFASVLFTVETAGSAIEGQEIVSLAVKVTRNGVAVPLCGDFTFSAADGSYTYEGQTTYGELTTLGKAVIFPTVKAGDLLTVTAKSASAEATVEITIDGDVEAGAYYPVSLQLPEGEVVEPEQPEEPETPEEPELPVEPETITGTFTCATYNIKGSSDGTIGTMITNDGWDFFHFSECFSGYSKNLGTYAFGSKSKTLGDGLYFGARKATCSLSGEYIDTYDHEYGGIFAGANTPVSKGFRYYLVTLADGVQVDVYITHMNTYDTQKHLDCQHKQLQEVATWIANHRNGRPVIFMGDTNCRYTRHDFETYFWSIIRAEGITINDPWVDYMWDGVYPEYPSKSLMVSDATGTNSETDIICPDTQSGEVVDKVIYINDANADTQIKANGYLRDMDYQGLSDHMPIVIEFTYTKTL